MAQTNKQSIIEYLLQTNNFCNTQEEIIKIIETLDITPQYKIVLVGGTNGKGSTCAYLTTFLTNAGYKVGTFTSPHVFDYNERIKINNQPISDDELCANLQKVIDASIINLGIFKTFTLASHLIFISQKIDIAIIEVGLGGGRDITNMFEPDISAITCVDYDHCDILGNTLEEIGLEKAGIYRATKPSFYGANLPPTSLVEYANSIGAQLTLFNRDFRYNKHEFSWDFISEESNLYSLPFPSMRGEEQLSNATLALAILNKLKREFPISISQIKNGLLQTSLIGRFQVMPGLPQIVLDTAHNPQAIDIMHKNMLKLQYAKRNLAVFSIANDKNWQEAVTKHAKNYDMWFLAPLGTSKSANIIEISNLLQQNNVKQENIVISKSITESFERAYMMLKNEDRLICFGSFITVEQSYIALKKIRK